MSPKRHPVPLVTLRLIHPTGWRSLAIYTYGAQHSDRVRTQDEARLGRRGSQGAGSRLMGSGQHAPDGDWTGAHGQLAVRDGSLGLGMGMGHPAERPHSSWPGLHWCVGRWSLMRVLRVSGDIIAAVAYVRAIPARRRGGLLHREFGLAVSEGGPVPMRLNVPIGGGPLHGLAWQHPVAVVAAVAVHRSPPYAEAQQPTPHYQRVLGCLGCLEETPPRSLNGEGNHSWYKMCGAGPKHNRMPHGRDIRSLQYGPAVNR